MVFSLRLYLAVFEYSLRVPRNKTVGFYNHQLRRGKSMKILNVAEKNDAAKTIASLLSRNTAHRREGCSAYNKIYEFECTVFNKNCQMIMTSVSGHLLNYEFVGKYRSWNWTHPVSLFDAPIAKICLPESEKIKNNLQNEVKKCDTLIIWTDCDREGENIGFEIIDTCKEVKPSIRVYRAVFSEITHQSVARALSSLVQPNKSVNDAVNVRMELDLRIGAAFTRAQCIYLRKAFPEALKNNVVSYGSCQFPTLGFVVERFKAISEFIPEKFWKINVNHTCNDLSVDFQWERNRLFDKLACEVLTDKCIEAKTAKVIKVESKPKMKWRPTPLDTIELEKKISAKFKINAKETLKIAEKLYSKGYISYPRTETNIFPKELNLVPLVQQQIVDPNWGDFAQRILMDKPQPFQGKKSDQAHPPIHPIKYTNSLTGSDKIVYEFIVRHFLACLSKHAEGLETQVEIIISDEKFRAKGLRIIARNYLDVYPYDKWGDKEIHSYQEGDTFTPEISMAENETKPPELLTEADLIGLMEKHGIGTDATHAEHIEKIKSRLYVGLQNDKFFVPRTLGMGLVEGYNRIGYEMTKPDLRAELEADLKKICEKIKTPEEVLRRHIGSYRDVFECFQSRLDVLSDAIQTYIQIEAVPVESAFNGNMNDVAVKKCPSCGAFMLLHKKGQQNYVVGCSNFPQCRNAHWLPSWVTEVSVTKNTCSTCGPDTRKLKFKFGNNSFDLPNDYEGCLGGCDDNLMRVLNCRNSGRQEKSAGCGVGDSRNRQQKRTLRGKASESPSDVANPTPLREINSADGVPADDPSTPNCLCDEPSVRLTVKKPGKNNGRIFYKCASRRGQCNFFEWKKDAEGVDADSVLRERAAEHGGRKLAGAVETSGEESGEILCHCALPTRRSTVSKNGPNKGRQFFSCRKFITDESKCNFFKWAD